MLLLLEVRVQEGRIGILIEESWMMPREGGIVWDRLLLRKGILHCCCLGMGRYLQTIIKSLKSLIPWTRGIMVV